MFRNLKKLLWGLFAIVMVVVGVIWFLRSDLEHIEDTNGSDQTRLATITQEDIVEMEMGCINVQKSTSALSDSIEFSSEKFTGVYEVCYNNYVLPSDVVLNLTNFTVDSGNFEMWIVHDDRAVALIPQGTFSEYYMEDVTGYVSIRIAGESAAFSFSMLEQDYDQFAHD